MTFADLNSILLLPEIVLLSATLCLLLLGIAKKNFQMTLGLGSLSLFGVAAIVYFFKMAVPSDGMFIDDAFIRFAKVVILLSAAVILSFASNYAVKHDMAHGEYAPLVMFSVLGMMLMLSSGSLLVLYLAIELQSLPLYVMAAMRRSKINSSEAGLKYYLLGAFSSALMLYGLSLIYGFSGTLDIAQIAQVENLNMYGLTFGVVMMLCGLAFKISAVPFHMWAPDVYEGAPTPVVSFFSVAPKFAAMAVITHILISPFAPFSSIWQQIILVLAFGSMIVGSVAAVRQTNIKRMLAYSSINHMGYALIGLAVFSHEGTIALLIYMALYAVMNIGTFAFILLLEKEGKEIEKISDLAGVGKEYPKLALAGAILMFSMAGIPPFAGFFAKLFIFKAAVAAGFYALAIVGVISSVVAAYYYLYVVKVMYFEPTAAKLTRVQSIWMNWAVYLSAMMMVFFIVYPAPLLSAAKLAAEAIIK